MRKAQPTQAQILHLKAAEDEKAFGWSELSDGIPGFHAQQAVEKPMKALLAELSEPYELTHNLGRLQTTLASTGEFLPPTPILLDQLNDFAVYRYDLLFQFASPNVTELKETVRLIREHAVARIAALSAAS
jgi:hypothetical protein